MLSRLFGERARRHRRRRPQPGDLRLARSLGVQHPPLRRHLPARPAAEDRHVPAHRQPALRPPHPRGRQPAGRAAPRQVRRPGRAARRQARRRAGRGRPPGCCRPRPTSSPGWPTRSRPPTTATGRSGPTIGVLTRDNAHAADVFDALTARDVPVEIVGLSGLIRLPEVAEVVATLHLLNDVTANAALLTLLTGPRWAIGPRDLRLLGRARPPSLAGSGPREAARWATSSSGSPTASTPPRSPPSATRSTRPATRRTRREALRALRRCSPPSCGCCARTVGEPLLDIVRRIIDTSGVDIELASAVSPGGRRTARQPRPVRQGGRRVPGRRRRRLAVGAAGLPHRRGRPGQRPRPRDPDGRRLGQAADRAPGQGPGVGARLPGRASARPGSRPTARARCGPPRPPCCRRRCAATRATCRSWPATTRRARRLPRRHPRPRPGGGAAARLRRVHPRRPPPQRHVLPLEPAAHALRPVRLPGGGPRPARGLGRAASRSALAGQARQGRPQPLRRRRPVAARGPSPGPGREAALRLEAARVVRRGRPDAPRRRPRHGRGRAGRRLGRRARPAGRRGPAPTATEVVEVPLPTSLSATALSRLRDRARDASPASWPGRCRGSRRRPPGSAPASTRGSRRGSASRTSSTPTSCPARPTPASTPTTTSPS